MLLRLFKGTSLGVILLIIITLFVIWISAVMNQRLHPRFIYETDPMPLYGLLKQAINNNHNIGVVLSFLIVSFMTYLMVDFNTTLFFINERTFLPAVFYVLLGGLFPDHQLLNPVLPASIFLILSMYRIMDGFHKTGIAYNYFDAAILIGIGSLFYVNLIWFGLLVIIGIAIMRTGSLNEILISLIGLITPYLITFGIYYVIGKDVNSLMRLIADNMFSRSTYYPFPKLTIVALVYIGTLITVSLFNLAKLMNIKKIKSRKTFSLLIWTFLIAIIVYYAVPSVSVEIIWLMGIPVSYFLAHYFVFVKKKLVPEILYILFIVFIVFIQIWYLK